MENNLILLEQKYKHYTGDPSYVYKKCIDILSKNRDRKWLVILKKLDNTKTNEARRKVFNDQCAKFRADRLEVVAIVNINKPTLTKKYIVNEYSQIGFTPSALNTSIHWNGVRPTIYIKLKYKVGKEVFVDNYDDTKVDDVCAAGIHYYKSLRAAYFHDIIPKKHCGFTYSFFDNGRLESEGSCVFGKKCGEWIYWYEDGKKFLKGVYENGRRSGEFVFCHNDVNQTYIATIQTK